MPEITELMILAESGDGQATQQLLLLIYDELRGLAAAKLSHEKPGQTLQPTALVHEAYLRLMANDANVQWNSRGHFFAAAAEAMRRILVEKARQKHGPKCGGGRVRIELSDTLAADDRNDEELLIVHEALDRLAADHPKHAELVKLRYFAGLSHQDSARALGISRATADRYWAFAKAYLFAELHDWAK
jgi:RNA polymerase sigma factor (TIGR02999 family)